MEIEVVQGVAWKFNPIILHNIKNPNLNFLPLYAIFKDKAYRKIKLP